uniref:Uncharacterized protein n=1 Tax=Oryza punctata TaxID=4537 RepID=A0A0E0LCX5_ORYPU
MEVYKLHPCSAYSSSKAIFSAFIASPPLSSSSRLLAHAVASTRSAVYSPRRARGQFNERSGRARPRTTGTN